MPTFAELLKSVPAVVIRQKHELAELIGFESRNKYLIEDESGQAIGYAAEQQKGWIGFLLRQFLGHWRRFTITVYDAQKTPALIATHPFRWIFQRVDVTLPDGQRLGAVQQRFSVLTKSFDVEDEHGQVTMTVRSGLLKFWTFQFERRGCEIARVEKKWSGIFSEAFTDRDQFRIAFVDADLTDTERLLLIASGIFIDLQYFERKAR